MTARYDRQTCLPEIGREGQKKLSCASVLCVGAGGLGSPALLYLAAAGLGKIGIVDFDRVDKSNLQRQILYTEADVGKSKAAQAAQRLKELNSEIAIKVYEEGLHAENAEQLFNSYDLIIDGTDHFEAKYLINDAAIKFRKPWIYGAIQRFDGQASVFDAARGPCYRCLFPQPPKARIMNCAEAGVIGAVAGMIGVTQAMQAIQLIIGHEDFEPLIGKLWTIDTKTMQTKVLSFKKNIHCPVCSTNFEKISLFYAAPTCEAVKEITIEQLRQIKNVCLIDVREQHEWDAGYIEGAVHWALSKMEKGEFPLLSKDKETVLYCQKGMRSLKAAALVKKHLGVSVGSLAGGNDAWKEQTI